MSHICWYMIKSVTLTRTEGAHVTCSFCYMRQDWTQFLMLRLPVFTRDETWLRDSDGDSFPPGSKQLVVIVTKCLRDLI